MKQKKNTIIIYTLTIIAIMLSTISLLGLLDKNTTNKTEWRCSFAECTEYINISGEEWARENCVITTDGTICLATFDDGRQQEVPLEELNLSAITATKCLSYTCTEETPYKIVNYEIDINEYNN
ncbi:MAG: hypothetical protein ACLFN8_05445 [Candidatus Woesearchaeota archaeon]